MWQVSFYLSYPLSYPRVVPVFFLLLLSIPHVLSFQETISAAPPVRPWSDITMVVDDPVNEQIPVISVISPRPSEHSDVPVEDNSSFNIGDVPFSRPPNVEEE